MKRLLIRTALGLIGVLAFVTIAGSIYESYARRSVRSEFLPSGNLIDIGGRHIQLDCRGSGSPTIVFEAGLDVAGSMSWANIHDQVAMKTRACAYSRAGILWSDPNIGARSGKTVALDLHAVLDKAGERPPFVLVGHSLGGPYALIYTKYYGQDVAGIVFVDPSHPDQTKRQSAIIGHLPQPPAYILKGLLWMQRFGIARILQGKVPRDASFAEKVIAAFRPASTEAMTQEGAVLDDTLAEAGTLRDLGARPVIVLTADRPFTEQQLKAGGMTQEQGLALQALWIQMHEEIASWSANGEHQVVSGGSVSHYIHRTNPEVVITAIDTVVTRVRAAEASTSE